MLESAWKFVVIYKSGLLNLLTGMFFIGSAAMADNTLKIPFACIAILFTWRGLSFLHKQRRLNSVEFKDET